MKILACLLPLFLLGAGPVERGHAGTYRLVGEQDVASALRLERGGRFRYFLMAGALDERAEGRWRVDGARLILTTEPRPVPPEIRPGPATTAPGSALKVAVSAPDGRGIPGVDVRIGFDEGDPVDGYTQEDGWTLPEGEGRSPRWVEVAVPMHGLASPRFPIDRESGNALAFTLVPNDLGVFDFAGVRVELAGKALIVHRNGAQLRYEAVRE